MTSTQPQTTQNQTGQHQALLTEIGKIVIEEHAIPEPGPHQVLIEVAAVGICGSDVHYFEHGRIADFVVEAPLVLGHEASGTIRAIGSEVTDRVVGQRVALEPQETCGRCTQCQAGRYNLCPDVQFFATPPVHGAFAQFVVLESHRAHPVPDSLSDEAAALIEPLSVGIWAAKKASIEPGDRVLVTGAGPVGLLCAAVAKARGAWVAISDTNQFRLETAKARGVDLAVDATAGSLRDQVGEVNVVIECSGVEVAVNSAFAAAAPAARIVLVGLGSDTMSLPVGLIQIKELLVTGTFRYANCYPAAIALAASGAVDLDGLVTGQFALSESAAALTSGRELPNTLKQIVYPNR